MECRRIVAGVEVYKSKVVADDPLEWIKIQRLFEAGNGGDEPLLAKEAHACVPARKRDWAGGEGETDRDRDRQAGRQTGRQTEALRAADTDGDRQAHRHTNRQTDRQTDGHR